MAFTRAAKDIKGHLCCVRDFTVLLCTVLYDSKTARSVRMREKLILVRPLFTGTNWAPTQLASLQLMRDSGVRKVVKN
jgi:hypothetical protein